MTYAITSRCCNDASCVAVCPVDCIHPTADEPGFGAAESLYVDPRTCIDCGACADACPVDAVVPLDALAAPDREEVVALTSTWYAGATPTPSAAPLRFPRALPGPLRVALVGTGPAAGYTARTLLSSADVELTVLDRSHVPGGLLRFGVAPDHASTRRLGEGFEGVFRSPRVRLHLGVEVGRDLSGAELLAHCHAVVYAVGAPDARTLGVPGETLPGCLPATDVVGWYNGAPGARGAPDLAHPRAVVVGHGNVALDVARVLLADPDALAVTDVARPALAALRSSAVREVVLLGRRGPAEAAFSRGELRALLRDPELQVVVADDPRVRAALRSAAPGSTAELLAGAPLVAHDPAAPPPPGRRVVLRFFATLAQVTGATRVDGLRLAGGEQVAAGLVVAAVGSRGRALPGLPVDPSTGSAAHERGRVHDPATGVVLPGTYVVGWAKRGARGGIGANRVDAQETVAALLDDAAAGRLPVPAAGARELDRLLARRARRAA